MQHALMLLLPITLARRPRRNREANVNDATPVCALTVRIEKCAQITGKLQGRQIGGQMCLHRSVSAQRIHNPTARRRQLTDRPFQAAASIPNGPEFGHMTDDGQFPHIIANADRI